MLDKKTRYIVQSRRETLKFVPHNFCIHQLYQWYYQYIINTTRRDVASTQSTVQPVPTRHRRHACIQMQTALSGNTRTWPNVVSMLAQRRWRWANIETALGQILVFAGLHKGVCLHPPLPCIIFLPADQGTFSKTAGQSQAYCNTWNWEWGTYDVTHLHILPCEVAVSMAGSVRGFLTHFATVWGARSAVPVDTLVSALTWRGRH